MFKKIIAFLLSTVLTLSCFVSVHAKVPYSREFASELTEKLNILNLGSMDLEGYITRAEFAKFAVKTSKYRNSVNKNAKISVFKDCTYKHWAAPYVKVAVETGLMYGYSDGTFKPDNKVSYQDALETMLKILGYTADDYIVNGSSALLDIAKKAEITTNINRNLIEAIKGKDILKLVYNTLNAKVKGTEKQYVSEFDVVLFDDVVLISTNAQDHNVAPGYVYTSEGTFKYDSSFSSSYVGTKGNMAATSSGEIIAYISEQQSKSRYVVYSTLGDSVVAYRDGYLAEFDVSDNTVVYCGSEKLTYSSAKSRFSTGDVIFKVKNASGGLEYLTLTENTIVGPETIPNNITGWYKAFTSDLAGLTVIRNGKEITANDVKGMDIAYYSDDLKTAFVYSKAVTGVYESAKPNKDTPESIIVSGVEYQIETVNAFNKLSSKGNLNYGTTIMLLLGKDGKIADVVTDLSPSGKNSSNENQFILYSTLGEDLIVYENGTLKELSVKNNTVIYMDSVKSSYSSAKEQMEAGDVLSIVRNESGDIEYITVSKDQLIGPEVVSPGNNEWYRVFTGNIADKTIIRNGEKQSASSVKAYDVVYYSKNLRTIFAYSKTVTGIYEEAKPNRDTPSSVVISGVEYGLETVSALKKLSSTGTLKYGTTVTAYLGKDGKIADVYKYDEVSGTDNSDDRIVVYTTIADSVIGYNGGKLKQYNFDESTTVYYNSSPISFSSALSKISMGDIIYIVNDENGNTDYITLTKGKLEGPVTVKNANSWYSGYTTDPNLLSVIRNGERVSWNSVKVNDIAYYSESLKTVFIHSKTVSGIYEEAKPDRNSPTSVVVSGVEYEIESFEAFKKLSSSDKFYYGKPVVLLLGKDGKIADVIVSDEVSNNGYFDYDNRIIVYSVLSDSVIGYDNGNLIQHEIDSDVPVYYGSGTTPFSAAKSQMSTGDVLYVVRDSYGMIDYLTLTKEKLRGPETITGDTNTWYENFTYNLATFAVVKDGERVDATNVKKNDVVYYSSNLNTAFVYTKKVTGIYEKALPNKDTPSSVVVSGVQYDIESITSFNKLSSNGSIKYGDTVTLLFGRDDRIADVVSSGMDSSTGNVLGGNKYVVYSVLSDSVIVYDNGKLAELSLTGNTTVYYNSSALNFSSAKSQMATGDVIYVIKDSEGKVDYLTLTKDKLQGPETVETSTWYTKYASDVSKLKLIRNGEQVSANEIKINDIIYYSENLNTVFAYAKAVTGIYEKALPNKDTPTSVVVSGTEYQIESLTAFNKLCSAGSLGYGSSVTLLIGKDGKVADVVNSDAASSSEVIGYLIASGKKTFENSQGGTYSSHFVTVILTDGSKVEYTTQKDCSAMKNSIVSITFTDGKAKVSKFYKNSSISGEVDYKSMTIGNYKVSPDVQILEVNTVNTNREANVIPVFVSRLDGVTLKTSSVLWYSKNKAGEIDKLILNDVTGDTSVYGIATQIPQRNPGSYVVDVAGKTYSYNGGVNKSITKLSPVELGVSLNSAAQTIDSLKAVTSRVTQIDGSVIVAGNTRYKLSDKVVAYIKNSIGDYSVIPLNELEPEKHNIKAYYDNKESNGGRIRVLIAK